MPFLHGNCSTMDSCNKKPNNIGFHWLIMQYPCRLSLEQVQNLCPRPALALKPTWVASQRGCKGLFLGGSGYSNYRIAVAKAWKVLLVVLLFAIMITGGVVAGAAQTFSCVKTTMTHEFDCPGSGGNSSGFHLSLGACQVVSTCEQRYQFGFQFGYVDGVMGAVALDGSTATAQSGYLYLGSAKSASRPGPCKGTPNTQGVYTLVPPVDRPAHISSADCNALLSPVNSHGNRNPQGVTGPYDRDYLGGGPAMKIKDGDTNLILLIYHAEFQYGSPRPGLANLFFGTLGMAVSKDDGKTFRKLGQIIQPHSSRKSWKKNSPNKALSVGNGPFVLGDEHGQPVSPRNPDPEQTYMYVYYIDQEPNVCNGQQCLAVARARLADILKAVDDPNGAAVPYLFRKYYKGPLEKEGHFDEPAATTDPNNNIPSGRYTPVLDKAFSPSIIYDPISRRALLAYQVPNQHTIAFRLSSNLVELPASTQLAILDERPNHGVRYPSLIQTGGEDDPQLWIFYTHDPVDSKGSWDTATFMARQIQITAIPK